MKPYSCCHPRRLSEAVKLREPQRTAAIATFMESTFLPNDGISSRVSAAQLYMCTYRPPMTRLGHATVSKVARRELPYSHKPLAHLYLRTHPHSARAATSPAMNFTTSMVLPYRTTQLASVYLGGVMPPAVQAPVEARTPRLRSPLIGAYSDRYAQWLSRLRRASESVGRASSRYLLGIREKGCMSSQVILCAGRTGIT